MKFSDSFEITMIITCLNIHCNSSAQYILYIEDILALGDTKECQENVNEVIFFFRKITFFLINRIKSITEPYQTVLYLRLLWGSDNVKYQS